MKVVSVITAIHAEGVEYLPEAYESLASQDLPRGWEWEWLIQEDGPGISTTKYSPFIDDERIKISSSRKGGPHVARTVALGRSQGSLIKNFDSDDRLAPGVLERDIRALQDNPVGWVTSRVLDMLPDGSTKGFPGDPDPGILPRGAVLAHWEQHRRAQVHPATLCARRELVMALGGWMALPSSGDTGLLLGLDALSPSGWFAHEVGLLYRKHDGQITANPAHSHGEEYDARMRVIREHAAALHLLDSTARLSPL